MGSKSEKMKWHSAAVEARLDVRESPEQRYHSLLELAAANDYDPNHVHRFVMEFHPALRLRYLMWFEADALLSHYRVWKDQDYGVDRLWIRVLQSRTNDTFLKIWLLGEDRVGLVGALLALLAKKGINIEQQYLTVSEMDFLVLSSHVENSVIERQFGQGSDRFKSAMLCLADYLRDGLQDRFASTGCVGNHCIRGIEPGALVSRRWINACRFQKVPAGWNPIPAGPAWWPVSKAESTEDGFDQEAVANPFLIGLSFQYPEVHYSPNRVAKERGPVEQPERLGGDKRATRRHDDRHPNRMEAPKPPEAIEQLAWDARAFSALSDPTRVLVLRCLVASNRRMSVSDIQAATGKEFATVSASLAKLRTAEFVESVRSGNQRLYSARIDLIRERLESQIAALLSANVES